MSRRRLSATQHLTEEEKKIRRRIQNKIAQRRHRDKKAMEKNQSTVDGTMSSNSITKRKRGNGHRFMTRYQQAREQNKKPETEVNAESGMTFIVSWHPYLLYRQISMNSRSK